MILCSRAASERGEHACNAISLFNTRDPSNPNDRFAPQLSVWLVLSCEPPHSLLNNAKKKCPPFHTPQSWRAHSHTQQLHPAQACTQKHYLLPDPIKNLLKPDRNLMIPLLIWLAFLIIKKTLAPIMHTDTHRHTRLHSRSRSSNIFHFLCPRCEPCISIICIRHMHTHTQSWCAALRVLYTFCTHVSRWRK